MACAVCLYGLALHSLWLDEAASLYLGSLRYSATFLQGVCLQHAKPPQYHLLVCAWTHPFEIGEAAVRLLSVFAGTVCLARSPQSEVLGQTRCLHEPEGAFCPCGLPRGERRSTRGRQREVSTPS